MTFRAQLRDTVAAASLVVPVVTKCTLLWQALALARLVVEVESNLTGSLRALAFAGTCVTVFVFSAKVY